MAVSEAAVHDQLAMHGLSLEERNTWWKTPLPELGRTPADMFSSDPRAVLLCAKYGCIGDRPRRTVLTPARLWEAPGQDTNTPEPTEIHQGHRVSVGGSTIFSDEAAGDGKTPEPAKVESAPDWWA